MNLTPLFTNRGQVIGDRFANSPYFRKLETFLFDEFDRAIRAIQVELRAGRITLYGMNMGRRVIIAVDDHAYVPEA
jgi:hypothetical protein